jgi:hypothetical protein
MHLRRERAHLLPVICAVCDGTGQRRLAGQKNNDGITLRRKAYAIDALTVDFVIF